MKPNKNITLILGILIPLLMILFIAGSIYIPRYFVHPQYNFLYMQGEDYNHEYIIQNNKLVVKENPIIPKSLEGQPSEVLPQYFPRFFIYDVRQDISSEVTLEQAQALDFYSDFVSLDGFKVVNGGNDNGVFPFFGIPRSDINAMYLVGRGLNKKLNIQTSETSYEPLRFIGWLVKFGL
jgi:hypothetical protein